MNELIHATELIRIKNKGLDNLPIKQTKGGGGISTVEKAWKL